MSVSTGVFMEKTLHLRLRGSKLAYYLKKRYPELYQRVREVKERYGVTWDTAASIVFGVLPEPCTSSTSTSSSVDVVVKSVEDLKAAVDDLRSSIQNIQIAISLLEWSILPRFIVDKFRCVYIDDDGFCTLRDFSLPVPGLKLKEVETPSGKRYRIDVYMHKLICAFCPFYKPRGESRW